MPHPSLPSSEEILQGKPDDITGHGEVTRPMPLSTLNPSDIANAQPSTSG